MDSSTRLTDEEIDRLDGRELDRVMCLHDGAYYAEGYMCKIEGHGWSEIPRYHYDLGAAMRLLMSLDALDIVIEILDGQCVVMRRLDLLHFNLASGPKDLAATVICRAFLNLKNRS